MSLKRAATPSATPSAIAAATPSSSSAATPSSSAATPSSSSATPAPAPAPPISSTAQPSPSNAAAITTWLKVVRVETEDHVRRLVDLLGEYLPTNPVSLYLNLEGIRFEKTHAYADGIVLFVAPQSTVYVIGFHPLSPKEAFLTRGSDGRQTLKSILESVHVPKAVFDMRKICAALSRLGDYRPDSNGSEVTLTITLQNIHDVQLMELATRERTESKRYLAGWGECILTDGDGSVKSASELPAHQPIPVFFDPRLLQLPVLWAKYHAKLTVPGGGMAFWMHMVREEIKVRMAESTGIWDYGSDKLDDVLSPWTESRIKTDLDSWKGSMHGRERDSHQWKAL